MNIWIQFETVEEVIHSVCKYVLHYSFSVDSLSLTFSCDGRILV